MRTIAPSEAYSVDALGPLQEVVEAVQNISQAPVAIAAQSALAVVALAVQGFADVETLGGDAPCSLFCLTIAESGERKSTCDRLLMKSLRDFERDQDQAYREATAKYDTEQKIWAEKKKTLIGAAAGMARDKATAANADLVRMGSEPKAPLFPNITAMEPTLEGLMKLYGIGNPSLGVFAAEAGGFIGGHSMNSDNRLKTMAGYSLLWDGEPIDRTRAGDGATTYRGRRLSAHLMVQPIVALPFLADPEASGQGFLARFLITFPASNIGTRLRRGHDPASDAAVTKFGEKLRGILETPMPTGSNRQELVPVRLTLSAGAKELLWRFHDEVERSQAAGGVMQGVKAYASKAVEQACRIAGVSTLWSDLDAPEVTAQTMASGIKLAGYYLAEANRLAEIGAVSAETARAEALRVWLLNSWEDDEFLPSDIVQYGPGALRERKILDAPLAMLVKHGWIVRMSEGTRVRDKPRKEAYRIVRLGHAV